MIEIVFSDSACGSLKMAQHYGEGPFRSGCIGVFVSHDDGSPATAEEIQAAQREYEEQARREWAQGAPMGGDAKDVYGFSLALSMGDISEDQPGPLRQQALEHLYDKVYPEERIVQSLLEGLDAQLLAIRDRIKAGEAVRIWYSSQPDELCGLYWFLTQLPKCAKDVYLVKLPEWELRGDGTISEVSSWGEITPGEWRRYLAFQRPAPAVFRQRCTALWRTLQRENAPLRATVNGRLVSVPETLYDGFIRREIRAEADVFPEARVVGSVLGKYQLGISDFWVALRIEEMIRTGELQAETAASPDQPIYHRMLRKRPGSPT